MESHYVEAQLPPWSTKVSFVGIDSADVKLPGNNQRVLNSIFKVTRIIYIVDWELYHNIAASSSSSMAIILLICESNQLSSILGVTSTKAQKDLKNSVWNWFGKWWVIFFKYLVQMTEFFSFCQKIKRQEDHWQPCLSRKNYRINKKILALKICKNEENSISFCS